jgi:hypothetical protein
VLRRIHVIGTVARGYEYPTMHLHLSAPDFDPDLVMQLVGILLRKPELEQSR